MNVNLRRDVVIWAMMILACVMGHRAQAAALRPNLLFILTDQQRFDALGVVNKAVQTPALDRLCREGVRFECTYVAQAVCTPSRATIVSGLYPHAHKLQENVYTEDDALANPQYKLAVTWPLLLQKAGYHTGYIGKWHLGLEGPKCFDEWLGFNSNMPHWLGEKYQSRYRSDDETDKGIDFIEQNKGKTFALYQSYYPPHTPFNPPKRFAELYRNSALRPAEYWGGVTAIDECVGRLLKKLDELKLTDNTVVVFTSDHGEHFGRRPGGSHKRAGYEESARVPLIIRYPRLFPAGTVRNQLVSNVDIMPTLLELAGVPIPEHLQGRSLVPLAEGRQVAWRKSIVVENREDMEKDEKGPKCDSRTIGNDRYKLILREKLSVRATALRELYDLRNDAAEATNIYGKDRAAVIGTLLDELEAWAASTQDEVAKSLAEACRADLGIAKLPRKEE